jgi:hypothetical protein
VSVVVIDAAGNRSAPCGGSLNARSRTLFLALTRRDRAIEDIGVVAPPAPRLEDIARRRARKNQEEEELGHVRHGDAEHDRPVR